MGALELALDYRLRWMDFDRFGNLRPTVILDLLQDMATIQANAMGIGRDDMLERGVFWALTRVRFEVASMPQRLESVTVRTWPHSPSRFSFQRDYQILDAQGKVLVSATSEWVLMDLAERKLSRVSDVYSANLPFVQERAIARKPRKIRWPEDQGRLAATVVPRFSDIDVNGHVNNSCYPGYVMDALDPKDGRAIRALQVDFRHEVLQGEALALSLAEADGATLAQGVKPNGDVAFNCSIEWA